MSRKTKFMLTTTVILVAGSMLPAMTQEAHSDLKSTAAGVYTKQQSLRGAGSFNDACSRCHQADNFKDKFIEGWAGNTVGALYESIYNTMPENRPGSLKPQQYSDILAFLFELNQLPEGKEELPGNTEALYKIVIERRQK